jgi:(E)-4-hydroxy-3-methylbut-2-enyl-diphosphate synthase
VGIAGGRGQGILFKKGEIVAKIPEAELKSRLLEEIALMVDEDIA